jgi:16S rRNA (uracil1498-N3)-methyltransferase
VDTANKFKFFLPNDGLDYPVKQGGSYFLTANDSHHATKVVRLHPGDEVIVSCPVSKDSFIAEILSNKTQSKLCEIKIKYKINRNKDDLTPITLLFGLAKGKKNDLVVEKATELGAQKIIFWQTDRSVVRVKSERELQEKIVRWQKIAESATKQCHGVELPDISLIMDNRQLKNELTDDLRALRLCCSLQEESVKFSSLIENTPQHIILAVGPEGDFTQNEYNLLKDLHFTPVSLGPNILRSETAAISALALARILFS